MGNLFQRKTQLNMLEEKKMHLEVLQNQSSEAVGVFTNAISQMKSINDNIQRESSEISSLIQELCNTQEDMLNTQSANENLIKKFETLLS